jgi:hypothetical protein
MARFPELFGRSSTKYQALAAWLAARHGIVDASLRDRFSAGGQRTLKINDTQYANLPRVFEYLQHDLAKISEAVKALSPEEATHYWKLPAIPEAKALLGCWTQKICDHVEYDKNIREFVSDLLKEIK